MAPVQAVPPPITRDPVQRQASTSPHPPRHVLDSVDVVLDRRGQDPGIRRPPLRHGRAAVTCSLCGIARHRSPRRVWGRFATPPSVGVQPSESPQAIATSTGSGGHRMLQSQPGCSLSRITTRATVRVFVFRGHLWRVDRPIAQFVRSCEIGASPSDRRVEWPVRVPFGDRAGEAAGRWVRWASITSTRWLCAPRRCAPAASRSDSRAARVPNVPVARYTCGTWRAPTEVVTLLAWSHKLASVLRTLAGR